MRFPPLCLRVSVVKYFVILKSGIKTLILYGHKVMILQEVPRRYIYAQPTALALPL